MPGTLPVPNHAALDKAIRFGLAVDGQIALHSVFARKNYFYPDLPKGYQISQYELPIVGEGRLRVRPGRRPLDRRRASQRAHLEEDAGKSLHDAFHAATGIDLNRAGTPLLEIVSAPVLYSAQEAVAYMRTVHTLVRWLGICDGNMQEGSFRCDANVSVRPASATRLGTRTEIKNVNSFRFVEKAIEYEIERQIRALENGETIVQETRLYDPTRHQTRPMRSKEVGERLPLLPRPRPAADRRDRRPTSLPYARRCPSCPTCAACAMSRRCDLSDEDAASSAPTRRPPTISRPCWAHSAR